MLQHGYSVDGGAEDLQHERHLGLRNLRHRSPAIANMKVSGCLHKRRRSLTGGKVNEKQTVGIIGIAPTAVNRVFTPGKDSIDFLEDDHKDINTAGRGCTWAKSTPINRVGDVTQPRGKP